MIRLGLLFGDVIVESHMDKDMEIKWKLGRNSLLYEMRKKNPIRPWGILR